MKNKKEIFAWSSDFEEFTGEGILARSFLFSVFDSFEDKIFIRSNNGKYIFFKKKIKRIRYKRYKNNFYSKYIKFFFGIFYLWKKKKEGYKTIYINYLPLWNFLIFLFLSKKTLLGPITGGSHIEKSNLLHSLVRRYLFPIFFWISCVILSKKFMPILFSTNMLKEYIFKDLKKKSLFEINLISFLPQKKKSKDIDYLFYYRSHPNKSNNFLRKIIFKLALNRKKKIFIVGDYLNCENVNNLGNIERKVLLKYLAKTKFSINSGENFYSLFAIDCISNHVNMFFDKNKLIKKNYYPKNSIHLIDFNNINSSYNKIKKYQKHKYFSISSMKILIKKKANLIGKLTEMNKINFWL